MKFKSLFAIAATALAFVLPGCEETENPGVPELTLTPAELSFEATAAASQTITLMATREWSVVSCPEWVGLSIESGPASTKEQSVTVSVEDNTGYTRSDVIVFYNLAGKKSVAITQEGPQGEYKVQAVTCAEFIKTDGQTEYIISGNVTSMSTQYSYAYISDGTAEVEVYQPTNWAEYVDKIKVGCKLTAQGVYTKYTNSSGRSYDELVGFILSVEDNGGNTSGGTAKGTGTLADPYNPAGAAAAVAGLSWTSKNDYQKTDPVYVKGKITRIADKGTFTEGGTYGNGSFYITDSDDATGEFYVFRALYLGNKKFTSGQTDIKVGDEVVICGALMNYQGDTPETVAGEAYLYSLNGETGGDTPAPTPSDPAGTGTLEDPYNAAGVLAYIATLNGAEESPADVYVKGKISSIKYFFSADYGTATFDISDDGTTSGSQFTCYSVYTLGNQAWVEGNSQIKEADEVIICGRVYNYDSKTPETVSKKAYIYSLNGKTTDTVSDLFGVENAAVSVGASATSATIKVTGNVAWTASSTDATVTPASGNGAGEVTVTFAANTDTENAKTYHVTLATTADVAEKTINVVITQGKVNTSGGESVSLTFPDENKAGNEVSSYTDTWTAKSGAHTWSITAFNNNKWNNWTYIRCGRKNNDSVADISSDVFSYPINSVVVTYDKFGSVNSTKLIVASDAAFTKDVQEIPGSGEKAGEVTYSIPAPAADRYYKLVIDNKSASANGSVQISKVVYSVD